MTILIEQRLATDCMIACIAMALTLPYEEVYEAAIKSEAYDPDSGEGIRSEDKILTELGLFKSPNYKEDASDFREQHKDWAIAPEFFRHKFWGRPAIFSVPSLNKVGGSHAVYYDGYKLYDPNPPTRNRYEKYDDLLPTNALVFRPNISLVLKNRRAFALAVAQLK
jgi:hypothetical protein